MPGDDKLVIDQLRTIISRDIDMHGRNIVNVGNLATKAELASQNVSGASGSFISQDGKIITVQNGIIVSII